MIKKHEKNIWVKDNNNRRRSNSRRRRRRVWQVTKWYNWCKHNRKFQQHHTATPVGLLSCSPDHDAAAEETPWRLIMRGGGVVFGTSGYYVFRGVCLVDEALGRAVTFLQVLSRSNSCCEDITRTRLVAKFEGLQFVSLTDSLWILYSLSSILLGTAKRTRTSWWFCLTLDQIFCSQVM